MTDHESTNVRAHMCITFLEKHQKHRAVIRKKSKMANANLLAAHQFAFSAVVSYLDRSPSGEYSAEAEDINARMMLIAQFIQGIGITENAISEGLYAQAANLLKQELETLASLEEFASDSRKDGVLPKYNGRVREFGRLYGGLNDVAHPTRREIVEQLASFSDAERYGPTTIPQFNKRYYQHLYGTHALFLIKLLEQMQSLFSKVLNVELDAEERRLVSIAGKILVDEGVVRKI